jgi:hypothetical protein
MKRMSKMTGFFCVFQYIKKKAPYCSAVGKKSFVSNGGSDRKAGKTMQTFDILLTVYHYVLYVSDVKRPSSGGTTLAVFGVSCVHF